MLRNCHPWALDSPKIEKKQGSWAKFPVSEDRKLTVYTHTRSLLFLADPCPSSPSPPVLVFISPHSTMVTVRLGLPEDEPCVGVGVGSMWVGMHMGMWVRG